MTCVQISRETCLTPQRREGTLVYDRSRWKPWTGHFNLIAVATVGRGVLEKSNQIKIKSNRNVLVDKFKFLLLIVSI